MSQQDEARSLAFDDSDMEAILGAEDQRAEPAGDAALSGEADGEVGPVAEGTIISEEEDLGGEDLESTGLGNEGTQVLGEAEAGETDAPKARGIGLRIKQVLGLDRYKMVGFVVGAAVFLSVATAFWTLGDREDRTIRPPLFQVFLASIRGGAAEVVYFDRFLVLMGDHSDQAYLLLSLSVMPSNSDVYGEVKRKRIQCRSVIYEVLQKSVAAAKEGTLVKEALRKDIADSLNAFLESGTVENVELVEFLTV